jgi:hypothetical protein
MTLAGGFSDFARACVKVRQRAEGKANSIPILEMLRNVIRDRFSLSVGHRGRHLKTDTIVADDGLGVYTVQA